MITELFYFCVGIFAALVFVRHRETILIRIIKRSRNEAKSAIEEALRMNRELEIMLAHTTLESKKPNSLVLATAKDVKRFACKNKKGGK